MKSKKIKSGLLLAAAIQTSLVSTAMAAEAFQLRYNLAGSLGGEMFAPPDQAGWAGGLALTYMDIQKITGNDGKPLMQTAPGGVVPLPAPAPSALYPSYASQAIEVRGSGTMPQWNLGLAFLTQDKFGGGRLAFALNIPYATKRQYLEAVGTTPALQWSPNVPASIQTAVTSRFNAQYQAGLSKMSDAETGEAVGLGDIEAQAGWLYNTEHLRVLAGASIVLPTGKYDSGAGPDVGFGNFYTLRPAFQLAYLPTPDLAFAGKVTLGLNSQNHDNHLRSGNWAGFEAAIGYKTAIGILGLHGIRVQQYQDDSNNPWGASRFRSSNVGVFFTTKTPIMDALLTLQYMDTIDSRNAKHGDFMQIRVIKLFQ